MLPGARDSEGRLYVTTVAPVTIDPYVAGLRLTPVGELYVTGLNQAWSPTQLFAAGEQGAWYDPSDLSTLFQDSAGTIPVTADGQPVGLILDKSGNDNHASQSTSTARPVYRTDGTYNWLEFDGIDDLISTVAVNFMAADKLSVFCGNTVLGTANQGFYTVGVSAINACNGLFIASSSPINRASLIGSSGAQAQITTPSDGPPAKTYVISHLFDFTGIATFDEIKNRQNGTLGPQIEQVGPAGAGSFSDNVVVIGDSSLGAFPLHGAIYSFIVRGAASSQVEVDETEAWVNGKTGAY